MGEEVAVEQRTVSPQRFEDVASGARSRELRLHRTPRRSHQPGQVLPGGQAERSGPGRPGASPSRRPAIGFAAACDRRRQARPADLSRETQLIEPLATVGGDAGGQDALLPRPRRQLEALKLLHHRQQPLAPLPLGARHQVLPAQQEAHEVSSADRLDLAAQTLLCVEMDAGEQAARAEFPDGRRVRGGPIFASFAIFKLAAQGEALGLQARQGDLDQPAIERGAESQLRRGDGTGTVEVTAHHRRRRLRLLGKRPAPDRLGHCDVRDDRGAGEEHLDEGPPFGREPQGTARARHPGAAPAFDEDLEEALPLRSRTHHHQAEQDVVKLVGIPGLGSHLVANPRDGGGIEPAEIPDALGQAAAQGHGAAAALLEGRIVQKGVGPPVQDLMGEWRRLGGVPEVHPHLSRLHGRKKRAQAIQIHRLVETVVKGLANQRVIRDLDGSGRVLLAGGEPRKQRRHQIVGLHALERRGISPPATPPEHQQGSPQVPAPAHREHRRCEDRLCEGVADGSRREETGDVLQGEAVLRTEGEQDGVVAGRRLELEIEAPAEALPQCQPESAVDPPTERRVHDQLHSPGLVEEALEHDVALGGNQAEGAMDRLQVARDLLGAGGIEAKLRGQPLGSGGPAPLFETLGEGGAQSGDLRGELRGPGRRFAQPEGNRGRRAPGIGHAHHAGLHPADPPGGATEQEDVAGRTLHGEVLVHGSHQAVVGIDQHPVIGGLGNRSPRGESGESGPATTAQDSVHPVAVQVGAAAASPGGDALGEQLHDRIEVLPREGREGRRSTHQRVEIRLLPALRRAGRDDLLGEDVEWGLGRLEAIQSPLPDPVKQCGALQQLVPGGRIEATLRRRSPGVARATDALEKGGEAARGSDLADQLHRPDVDAELQRGGGDQGAQLAGTQPPLQSQPPCLGEASVMGGDAVFAEALRQQMGDPLRGAPGVDEDQGGAVLLHVGSDGVEDLTPLFVGGHRPELASRYLEGEIHVPAVPEVDDRTAAPVGRTLSFSDAADQEPGHRLDGALGSRETDPSGSPIRERREPLQGQGQVGAALVAGHGVDLVDDHRAHRAQRLAALPRRDHQVERLRRGDQQVGRTPEHRDAGRGCGVAGADLGADLRQLDVELPSHRADFGEGNLEIVVDVVGQGLERGDVDDPGLVGELALPLRIADQTIDADQEGGQRLSGAGGSGDQGVAAPGDGRPARGLGLGRSTGKTSLEPGANDGMEGLECIHQTTRSKSEFLTRLRIPRPHRPMCRKSAGVPGGRSPSAAAQALEDFLG